MGEKPRITVVVPLYDEEPNVGPLVESVRSALGPGSEWELILVDDGSEDGTARRAGELAAADPRLRLIRLACNYGQTAAMQAGFDHAAGEVVVSMDGDLQNDPLDIPRLVEKLDEGFDLVAGYRSDRQDRLLTRKVPSWVANRLIRLLSGVPIRDNGCSLKAYRRQLLSRVHLYSDMHRFIPAVAAATAGARIAEIPVRHHPRRHGSSKYGLSRVWKVLADLLTIKMIGSFRDRPLVMFAAGATVFAVPGFFFAVLALVDPPHTPEGGAYIVFPTVSLILLALAWYLLMTGLVAEVALGEQRREDGLALPVVHEL